MADGTTKTFNQLNPGDFFGEISLVPGSIMATSVTARKPVVCLRLEGSDFNEFVSLAPALRRPIKKMLHRRAIGRLSELPLMSSAFQKDEESIQRLCEMFEIESADPGEVIFRQAQ